MSSKQAGKLTVGQKLWLVRAQRGDAGREVTVVKIGRAWAYIDYHEYRIDPATLAVDGKGYSPPAQCYISKAEYAAGVSLRRAWDLLRRKIDDQYGVPPGITEADIDLAANSLGLKLQD